jgi:hypothetical protein
MKTGKSSTQNLPYTDHYEARRVDHIEIHYNPKLGQSLSQRLAPLGYEKKHFQRLASV